MLSRAHVTRAPVVDNTGRCIGVLSNTDILHWVEDADPHVHPKPAQPGVCHSWQIFGNEAAPTDCVRGHITAEPGDGIAERADRRIVPDDDRRPHPPPDRRRSRRTPIGIVSSTDILAAVAREAQGQ